MATKKALLPYIKSGTMSKLLASPKPWFSDGLLELQNKLDKAHQAYDISRCSDSRTWMPAKRNDETRQLGKIFASLQKQYNEQFDVENPEYVKHWRG